MKLVKWCDLQHSSSNYQVRRTVIAKEYYQIAICEVKRHDQDAPCLPTRVLPQLWYLALLEPGYGIQLLMTKLCVWMPCIA